MNEKPDHLTDEADAVLTESMDERVYFVRSKRWIAYPKAVEILGHLNALLKHPRTTRMPSLAVYGDSGMGKSMLVEKFKDDYAQTAEDRPREPKTKLLVVELAGRPNERRLYAQILAVVGAPQNPRATIVELERTAVRLLGDLGVQVLILDEIHNVLAASWREQRVVFNTLRYLSNELKLSLVCFGIMEARQAINGDVQLARRFDAVSLPRWTAGKEFEQLVLAIIRNLPLREPSVLTVKGLCNMEKPSNVRISSGIYSQVKWLPCRKVPYSQAKMAPDRVAFGSSRSNFRHVVRVGLAAPRGLGREDRRDIWRCRGPEGGIAARSRMRKP